MGRSGRQHVTSASHAIAPAGSAPRPAASHLAGLAAGWPAAVAIVGFAVLQQAVGHLNGDVSWFITFAERVLGGARPYVDIGDPNPPAAFLVYMPAVLAAQATGLRAEFFVGVELFALVVASLVLTARVLRPLVRGNAENAGLLRNAALWVLLVVPGFGFAEREHVALVAILPLLATFVMRAEGQGVALLPALFAGVAGGAALSFKPHYALAVGFAALAAALARRSVAILVRPELFAAGSIMAAHALAVWICFPDYVTRMLPLALDVYAPARHGALAILFWPPVLANAGLLAAVAIGAKRLAAPARVGVLVAASAGFLLTVGVQAKLWFNHAYPGLALAALAAVVLWLGRRGTSPAADRFGRLCALPALACALFFFAPTMSVPGAEEHRGLRDAIRAVAPAKPKIAALAEQLDLGHPVVRELGGTWVGRQNALWITNCVNQILATSHIDDARRDKLQAYARQDRQDFADDVAAGRPDVLVVETSGLRRWAERQPEFAGFFDRYRHAADAAEVEIWTLRLDGKM